MDKLKNFLLQYFDKIAIFLAVAVIGYAIYGYKENSTKEESITKIEDSFPVIERNFKLGKQPEPEPLNYVAKIEKNFREMPEPPRMQFEAPMPPDSERMAEFAPGDTEIIFKGGTREKAIVLIRKTTGEMVIEQNFFIRPGDGIGVNKPIIGEKLIDYMTGCSLLEIIDYAKKALNANKIKVNLNENGEFVSSSNISEPYYVKTMKIRFKNDRLDGREQEALLGDIVNIGTITPLLKANRQAGADYEKSRNVFNEITASPESDSEDYKTMDDAPEATHPVNTTAEDVKDDGKSKNVGNIYSRAINSAKAASENETDKLIKETSEYVEPGAAK